MEWEEIIDPEYLIVNMCSYLYELPTTGAISFGDFVYDQSASYISEVSETTEARANLRAALKESKRTGEKDYLRLVKVKYILVKLYQVNVSYECSFWTTTFLSSVGLSPQSTQASLSYGQSPVGTRFPSTSRS